MNIVIGSKNKAKINAVKSVFKNHQVVSHRAKSNVSNQPLSNDETRKGAINRAYDCYKKMPDRLCIGLEGGITFIDDLLYLCSWGALVAENRTYTAGGANIMLPNEFIAPLKNGAELAHLMNSYTGLDDVRQGEGAIGIFTNGAITRTELFSHIVKILKGQWEYNRIKES